MSRARRQSIAALNSAQRELSEAQAELSRRRSVDNEQAFSVQGVSVGQELLALGLGPNGTREWFRAKVMALRAPPSWPPILVKVCFTIL